MSTRNSLLYRIAMRLHLMALIVSCLVLIVACFAGFSGRSTSAQELKEVDQALITTSSGFSIIARDMDTGELGVAVVSSSFSVGSIVPWAEANIGAIAIQSLANTSFGWKGLELLEKGLTPKETVEILMRHDDYPEKRQIGIVAAEGRSAIYTGKDCAPWAGGLSGSNYAVIGNGLAGESVTTAIEQDFLKTEGTLAERLYSALLAGRKANGDSSAKKSAAMLVVEEDAGYGGDSNRAIDIRVDDHADALIELGRLLPIAQINYARNIARAAFTQGEYEAALSKIEWAFQLTPDNPEILYDLAVIRLAAGQEDLAIDALRTALQLNPKLRELAIKDPNLSALSANATFHMLVTGGK